MSTLWLLLCFSTNNLFNTPSPSCSPLPLIPPLFGSSSLSLSTCQMWFSSRPLAVFFLPPVTLLLFAFFTPHCYSCVLCTYLSLCETYFPATLQNFHISPLFRVPPFSFCVVPSQTLCFPWHLHSLDFSPLQLPFNHPPSLTISSSPFILFVYLLLFLHNSLSCLLTFYFA